MQDVFFTFNAVAPVALVILLGAILRRKGWIDGEFVRRGSQLVFWFALPALLFVQLTTGQLEPGAVGLPILLFVGLTVLVFGLSWLIGAWLFGSGPALGALVQGSFRGNIAIIVLPILMHVLDETGLTMAVVLLAISMPLYNLLAVVALTVTQFKGFCGRRIFVSLLRNPLIGAALVAALWRLTGWPVPVVLARTTASLGQMTFPLALLGVGASLKVHGFRARIGPVALAACFKMAILPLSISALAWMLGIRDQRLAALCLLTGAPAAVSGFIMAKAMGSDSDLAAAIVAVTTLIALPAMSLSIFLLRMMGLV